ncbi:hypothetical protein JOM56_005979 [Amanita muscaria]
MSFIDPGRSDNAETWDDWDTVPLTAVGTRVLPVRRGSVLPPARSKNSLHQNLLYLINQSDPIPSLPALVDFHDMHPEFQSTRSHNLLIDLALRHASFGTVQWLFRSMKARGISPNAETSKLHVRWLVRTRRWSQVLNLVRKFQPDYCRPFFKRRSPNPSQQNFPLPIWLELFPPARPGSVRHKAGSDGILDVEDNSPASLGSELEQPNEVALQTFCHQLLMEIKSRMVPENLLGIPPRLVYHMIRIMIQSGHQAAARSLTVSYLANLPETLSYRFARSCLELIHLHLMCGSSRKGLPQFYEASRTLFSLLKLHRGIRPTSSTLLLILGPLRNAKRCGTIAWKVLQSFRSQFGLRVVDSRVRRRIVTLASKEGRVDIIDRVTSYQLSFHHSRRSWKLEREVLGGMEPFPPRKILRAPQRKIFRRNGKEQRTWRLLNRRLLSRMVAKQSKK